MEITERMENNVLVLTLNGDLMGGPDTENFRKCVDNAIKDNHSEIVVDMGNVSWMNSSGLGMLISALTSLRSSNGDLKLANLSERVRRPLQITKLDSVFQQFDTVAKAVQSYK